MIVYIIMLLISIMFIYISTKVQNKWLKILCYVLTVLPFFLVSALRYDVGTDYFKRYNYDYSRMSQGIEVKNLEIGFKWIIKFCLLFTQDSYLLFVVSSAITVGIIMYIIIKKSSNPLLSILIFFLGGFFFDSLNILRQYLAISIVLLGYPFLLEDKKKILYAFCVICAGLLHSTAFIMIALLFLDKKMLVTWKWVMSLVIIILILNERILSVIGFFIQNTRFAVYLTNKFAEGEISFLFIAENLFIYLFMYYIYNRNKKMQKIQREDILFLNIQALSLLTMVSGVCHQLFIRIALYFSAFQIISIPYFIRKMPNEIIVEDIKKLTKNKINLEKIKNNLQAYCTIIIILCYIFAFTRTNILNNTNGVLPYRTILNKQLLIK